ncbi:MAG: flagellar motor protein MotB [Bacteroidota bacterium]
MKKTLLIVFILCACMITARTAVFAQVADTYPRIGLQFHEVIPATEFWESDGLKNSYQGRGLVRFSITGNLEGEFGGGFLLLSGLDLNRQYYRTNIYPLDFRVNWYPLTIDIMKPLIVKPYGYIGVGALYYHAVFGSPSPDILHPPSSGTAHVDQDGFGGYVPLGLGLEIPLSPRVSLDITGGYNYSFNDDLNYYQFVNENKTHSDAWYTIGIGLNVAISAPAKEVTVVERDVQFSVRSPKIVPVQRKVRETLPLRNYVFFDEGSTAIPNRYVMLTKDQAASFKEEQLQEAQPKELIGRSRRQLNAYHNILNTVGDRLRKYPGATVSLIGASEKGPEDGRALAESIKQYLVNVFGIDGSRIVTEGREKPLIPSEQPGGTKELGLLRAEDRRVNIESSSPDMLVQFESRQPDLLKPVQIFSVQDDPPDSYVLFTVTGASELLSSWSLELKDGTGNVQRFGPFTRDYEHISGKSILGDRTEGNYNVVMLGQTKSGKMVRKEGSFSLLRKETPKDETGLRFSVLYRFDISKATSGYEKFLVDVVTPLIPEGANVIIHGHTDIIGEEEHNLSLSRDRARDVQNILERSVSNAGKQKVSFETYGFGADVHSAPFENDFPEERCYNRTVIIDIVPAK